RLVQMYLRGEISRYDYETEIDAREAEREQERMESNTAISQDMNNIDRIGRETASGAAAIREATSENANDNLTAEQRLDALDALRNNTREARREEDEKIVWQAQFLE
ncbi:MAG: hypothetical protein IJV04_09280, partial [Lachnospiraceae bacterium]|nr:hypothetical protein [Lachnospiraceae bacterium]